MKKKPAKVALSADPLLTELRELIDAARQRVATTANAELTMLYWRIGTRIRIEILQEQRAEYGEQIVSTLSRQLTNEYGEGFSNKNLFRMIRFAEYFPAEQIVSTLSAQLSWSHFIEILPVKEDLARQFYAEMCRLERWSVRTLRDKIRSMLFERTVISRKPGELIKQELQELQENDRLTPDLVFRDPYLLNFLGLADTYAEKDLEQAVVREVERFLLEMGGHFTFVARQKRIVIDGRDYKIDLLLFHRALRRLVALDFKIGHLEAAHKGQMELYLRWLDKHERLAHEDTPLGLILCAEAGAEQVELLQLDQGSIRVAQYLTELPPLDLLQTKLREARLIAQNRLLSEPVTSDLS
ncbi:MAG TPA: PDDEXK nuclease domain-containing protein [Blastocatellia bacterium]|nr:PDDEXK nuclease domain-containing protein [Blastocatellia bacterium]